MDLESVTSDSQTMQSTAADFDMIINHHELVLAAYKLKTDWWNEEIQINSRCKRCWLRCYECFCSELSQQAQIVSNFKEDVAVRMCIYYHYQEIGRSPNTAHLYESLYSYANLCRDMKSTCDTLLFGDTQAEHALIHDIHKEIENNLPQTCILYPTCNAPYISHWLKSRPSAAQNLPPRIVVLDGTYPQASRQYKYLAKSLELMHGNQLPVVKLDLGNRPVRSALYGIQSQPGVDKLCSYQAMVMALHQIGQTPELCEYLTECLDTWLKNILERKIKLGKLCQNVKLDMEPADYVKEYQRRNRPQVLAESLSNSHGTQHPSKSLHESIKIVQTAHFSAYAVINIHQ